MNKLLFRCLLPFTAFLTMTLSVPAAGQAPPDFSNVSDILQGARFFVRDDDLLLLQRAQPASGPQQVLLNTMQTASGRLSGAGGTLLANQVDNVTMLQGYSSSLASGRVFSTSRDFGVVLAQSTYGQSPTVFWELTVTDSSFTTNAPILRQQLSGAGPTQATAAQVVTGDFTGDGFADVLAFYANVSASGAATQTYMSAAAAQDVTTPASGLRSGAALSAPNSWLVGSATAGDFDGDGRADIALLDNLGNLVICSVDPKTLAISQSNVLKLPVALSNGIAVAARYRTTPNRELAIVGVQVSGGVRLATIIPVSFTAGSLTPTVLPAVVMPDTYSGVDIVPGVAPLFAAVGPIQDTSTDIDQLVVGFTSQGGGILNVSAAPEELGTTTVHVLLADPLPHVQNLIADTAKLAMRGSDRLHLTELLREVEGMLVGTRDVEFAVALLAHYRSEIESMRSNMLPVAEADALLAKVDLAASCAGAGVPAVAAR